MRGMKNETNGSAKVNKVVSGGGGGGPRGRDGVGGPCVTSCWLIFQDEDLKWVEENIPSSMADV